MLLESAFNALSSQRSAVLTMTVVIEWARPTPLDETGTISLLEQSLFLCGSCW